MNLTRQGKNRIIKTLKKTKPFIAYDRCPFVCMAIEKTNSSEKDKSLTMDYVDNLIGEYVTVVSWLRHEHNIRLNEEQCYQYRIQWIDHMIKELSE